MNFLVAAATSSLSPHESTNRPPRKRMRRNLRVDTGSKSQPHASLSELISSLEPLTPLEHDIIHRAFYAGIAHESASARRHNVFAFNDSDIDSSDNEISSLDLLADAVYAKKHGTHTALKRRLSEETFVIASFLGQMRHLPARDSIKKANRIRVALRAKQSLPSWTADGDKEAKISKNIARNSRKCEPKDKTSKLAVKNLIKIKLKRNSKKRHRCDKALTNKRVKRNKPAKQQVGK